MTKRRDLPAVRGVLLDEQTTFTLSEFTRACHIHRELVVEMVEEGIIEPLGARPEDWRFHGRALVRAQQALRLVRDLHVNWPGAALALDLLEELDRLERYPGRLRRRRDTL